VGTNERIEITIKKNAPKGAIFDVVSNPEFLREGTAIEDMKNTNRTVIGTKSVRALKIMKNLYKDINAPMVECDLRSAEMIKYASNALLATKISFINEIGQLCERAGANVQIVAEGVGLDRRIGRSFLNATGVGYGGSCFPKDVAALYKTSTDQAYDFKLLRSVMEVNELQKNNFMKKITKAMGDNLSDYVFGILGLAFKNDTDDIRESGAIKMIRMIRGHGAKLRVYDPAAIENTKKVLGYDDIYYANDIYDAMENVDALCIFTEWSEFKLLDLIKAKKYMKGNLLFDARNLLDQESVEGAGFSYFAVGKRTNGYTEDGDIVSTAILRNGK
jgi:UDPglucose 6-dehydrogenase